MFDWYVIMIYNMLRFPAHFHMLKTKDIVAVTRRRTAAVKAVAPSQTGGRRTIARGRASGRIVAAESLRAPFISPENQNLILRDESFDPVLAIHPECSIASIADPRSAKLEVVDWGKVVFEHCLSEGEDFITGEEKMLRLQELARREGRILLDAAVGWSLFNLYPHRMPDFFRGFQCLDFPGTLLSNKSGHQSLFYIYFGPAGWKKSTACLKGLSQSRATPSATLKV